MAKLTLPATELNEFDLPRICVLTGATEGVVFKDVKFSWYPRWVAALVIVNLLVAAVVAFALTKKVKGKLPFTEDAYATWRRAVLMQGLSVVSAIGLLIASMILFATDSVVLGLVALVATVAVPTAGALLFVRGKLVSCTRISDGTIDLKIPSEQVSLAFQQHLHAGVEVPAMAAPAL